MKYKIVFLGLLFLSAGLFSSSKENAGVTKGVCMFKTMEKVSIVENKCVSKDEEEEISPRNFFLNVVIKPI